MPIHTALAQAQWVENPFFFREGDVGTKRANKKIHQLELNAGSIQDI